MEEIFLYEQYHKKNKLQKQVITLEDFTYKNVLNKIVKYLSKIDTALDIGSATGTISFFLASKGIKVDGIELSTSAIKYANLNKKVFSSSNINFINSSIENYNVRKKYDLIICFEVIEHLKDDKENLTKIKSFMRNNSILAISVPSKNAPLYRIGLLDNFDKKVGHFRRYLMEEIIYLLNDTGFIVIESHKTEGVIRNLMFTNKLINFLVKLTRFNIVNKLISYLDEKTISIFGESQLILICKKK